MIAFLLNNTAVDNKFFIIIFWKRFLFVGRQIDSFHGVSLLICITRSLFKASLLHDYRERAPTSWLQIYRVSTSSPEFALSLGFIIVRG